MAPKVVFLMADYGHDPTETAIPWKIFNDAGFEVVFATENGKQPSCDDKMLSGVTGALLGASRKAKDAYQSLVKISSFQSPLAWTDAFFDLDQFDLVFLPGGHEKSVRQVIDSSKVHQLIASYFPKTRKPSNKSIAAICHGVQVLASSSQDDGKSVIHDAETTALPTTFEESIFQSTRIFLGDYYKTYGAGSPSVQRVVTSKLDDPSQFKCSLGLTPFVVADANYNYLSARFPPDSELLAKKAVDMVKGALEPST